MAIDVNWVTGVIYVPKADTTLIQASPEIREFDVLQFHLDLRTLQAAQGQMFPTTHNHITGPVLSGTQYSDFVEILNPYTVEFEDGQYTVKVTGANNNLVDVKVANQTSIATENSAGLIVGGGGAGGWDQLVNDYLDPGSFGFSMAEQEYDGKVFLDAVNGAPGTTYPLGTRANPSSNWADAMSLMSLFKADTLVIKSAVTATSPATGIHILGLGEMASINLNGQAHQDIELERLTVTGNGASSGYLRVIECWVSALTATGVFKDCILLDTFVISGPAGVRFMDCASGFAGPGAPVVDMAGVAGAKLEMRRYSGSVDILGMANANNAVSVETRGNVTLDASCVQGSISIRGQGIFTNNGGPGVVVENSAFLNLDRITAANWAADASTMLTVGTVGWSQALAHYGGWVEVDPLHGVSGTAYPAGTHEVPVNNWDDALTLSATYGIEKFRIRHTVTLTDDADDFVIEGVGEEAELNVAGRKLADAQVRNVKVTGTIGQGPTLFEDCEFDGVSGIYGMARRCTLLTGTTALGGNLRLIHCTSGVAGSGTPVLDFAGGAGRGVEFRGYSGGIDIRGMVNAADKVSVDMVAGQVVVDASNTAGQIELRGTGYVTDNGAGVAVNTRAFINKPDMAQSVWRGLQIPPADFTG